MNADNAPRGNGQLHVITVWKHQNAKHVKHERKTAPRQPFGLFLGMSTCEIGHTRSSRDINESDIRD